MKTPQLWKHLKRHPLSAEYRDITGPAWMGFTLKMKRVGFLKGFPIILHDGQVIDGWQRLRACIELNIEPVCAELPKGITPEDYVESVNDERRHETTEERAERIQRVAASRAEGKSLQTIADEEGVSKAQTRRDLDAAAPGVPGGGTPGATDGKITGKDGKEYPATKPKPLCPACAHRQSLNRPLIENCEQCEALRNPKPPKADDEKPPKSGRLKFDDTAFEKVYGPLVRFVDRRGEAMGRGKRHTRLHDLLGLFLAEYKQWKKES